MSSPVPATQLDYLIRSVSTILYLIHPRAESGSNSLRTPSQVERLSRIVDGLALLFVNNPKEIAALTVKQYRDGVDLFVAVKGDGEDVK